MPPTKAGEKTRSAILAEATRLATVEGLDGLSLNQLAVATEMSKSGLYAHFGSKEELQLATIRTAREIFIEEVVRPGQAAPAGMPRLRATCEAFLSHVEREVFPGGCFFAGAAAEVGTRRGHVHDEVAAQQKEWLELLASLVRAAQKRAEIADSEDPAQLAFELNAVLVAANSSFILHRDSGAFGRARAAVERRLLAATPPRARG